MKQLCQLSMFTTLLSISSNSLAASDVKKANDICQMPSQQSANKGKTVNISADRVTLIENDQADFKGNVEICGQQISVTSDTAQLSRRNKSVRADGDISYHNEVIDVTSTGFEASLSDQTVSLEQATYTLSSSVGRGKADLLEVNEANQVLLKEATFTTCPIEDDSWLLSAEKISLSSQDGWGAAWNAAIKVNDTPVLYIPYLTFPLDDRRKTGFLYPNFSSSTKNGAEIKTPWYWNAAPNLDATFTPRVMTKRGVQLQTEFRYLTEQQSGLLNFEYLPSDNEKPDLDGRHLVYWQHQSEFSDNFRAFLDFSQISDDNYLNDLGSKYHDSTATQLDQQLELAYFANNVDATIRLQNFEILGQHPSSYQTLPQINVSNRDPYHVGAFDLNWMGEVSHFVNSEAAIDVANRLHFEPSIAFNQNTIAWSFNTQLSLLQTNYWQSYQEDLNTTDLDISRTLPKFRMHGQVNFERPATLFKQEGIQTFEPRAQYLYVPYKDQNRIGLFDSTRLQDDYYGLFRDNRFSGLDRITDANQITLGATSRFINPQNEELMRVSFGQIFYFQHERNIFSENDTRLNSSKSALAGELFVHWSKRWYLNANIQYDTGTRHISKSNLTIDYRADKNTLAQLNHRRTRDVSGVEIEQLGLIASFPIAEQWQVVGGYHRDLTQGRSIDSYFGLQYESCCWAIRLVSSRHINTNFEQMTQQTAGNPNSFDNGISLQLVIKGLGGKNGLNIADMLQQGIFGYRRPYFLSN